MHHHFRVFLNVRFRNEVLKIAFPVFQARTFHNMCNKFKYLFNFQARLFEMKDVHKISTLCFVSPCILECLIYPLQTWQLYYYCGMKHFLLWLVMAWLRYTTFSYRCNYFVYGLLHRNPVSNQTGGPCGRCGRCTMIVMMMGNYYYYPLLNLIR